jgi:hypothetical protein
MRGASGIPELRLEVLQGLVERFMWDPNLLFTNMFPSIDAESDLIWWEEKHGSRGLAPFIAPGSRSPRTAPLGIAERTAKAAFMSEKMHFDEDFLNNLRKEGTIQQYKSAQQTLVENMAMLINRNQRRVEWMFSEMLLSGGFTYIQKSGASLNVDYHVPSDHMVDLGVEYYWGSGSKADILGDVTTGLTKVSTANGGKVNYMVMNTNTLKLITLDDRIISLLQKSTFGDGSLFNADVAGRLAGINAAVIGKLLNMANFIIWDEQYVIRHYLTANVAAAATTIYVDDATDFVAGQTLRIHDASDEDGAYEDLTISSVSHANNTITVETGPTSAYKVREDYVTMTKYYVPNYKVLMMADVVEGQPIAKYMRAPYGNNRVWGMNTDTHEEWDPDGIEIRVQNKGLPVLQQRDAIYVLTVKQ